MKIVEEPSTFLLRAFVQSGRNASKHSWWAAAYAIAHWFETLNHLGLDWQIATRENLIRYRDAHFAPGIISPQTGRPYSKNTVRSRMLYIIQFYSFQARAGVYSGSLHVESMRSVTKEPRTRLDAATYTQRNSAQGELTSLLPRKRRATSPIRPFSGVEWDKFTEALGPLPSEQLNAQAQSCRNRLIIILTVLTGLRVSEVMRLTCHDFLTMKPDTNSPAVEQPLNVNGKGDIDRLVGIPNWLVAEVQTYIHGERARAVQSIRAAGRKTNVSALFVSNVGHSRVGLPMTKRCYQKVVENACVAAGLTKIIQRTDPITRSITWVEKPKHCFHDLRHTFAVLLYQAERAIGNPEPWKRVQQALGHKYLKETIETYISFVTVFDNTPHVVNTWDLIGQTLPGRPT